MRPSPIHFAALALLLPAGCDSYWERKELIRDHDRLEARQRELEAAIRTISAGKTTFTEKERAALGPLGIELAKVKGEIDRINDRLRALN